jgi:hypothetical protein
MAVSINSRYRQLAAYSAAAADGTVRATLPIRRTPAPAGPTYRHRVSGVEDIEYLAWRYLRDSQAWWALADANPVAFPLDVSAGDIVGVPVGARTGGTDRTRVFR